VISNEQAVIAAVLLDSRVLRFAAEECAPADFGDQRLGAIYRRLAVMFSNREPIDVITVGTRLATWNDVRGVEAADLHTWIGELPTAQNVTWYAAQVREDAVRRGLQEIAIRLQNALTSDPALALAGAQKDLVNLRDNHASTAMQPVPLGNILEGDDEYDWVIDGLLERGDRMLLTGVEGGGKSTLVRQLAILSAAGMHPFTFFPMRPARVLIVDAENSEKQWRRAARPLVAKAALQGSLNPAEVIRIICAPRLDLSKDQDLGQVHRMVDEHRPDLLFIGPLYRLIPRAINSDDDAAPLLAALDTLRERGLAMVIEAHAGHAIGAGGVRDLRPRGSAALLGWPEFGLGLQVNKNARTSNEYQLVRWRGDRDQRKWPTRIARGMTSWPWTPTAPF